MLRETEDKDDKRHQCWIYGCLFYDDCDIKEPMFYYGYSDQGSEDVEEKHASWQQITIINAVEYSDFHVGQGEY